MQEPHWWQTLLKMVDGPDEGQALPGCKVMKLLELEGFRHRMARARRTWHKEGFGLAQEWIQWDALLCAPPKRVMEGVRDTWVESRKPKMDGWQDPCSPLTEQYAMPAKMWMQPETLKWLCAQICCGFRQSGACSCRTGQRRTGSNCTIEVHNTLYIPPQTTTTQGKLLKRKWSMCTSGWKEKDHQHKLQQVTPPPVQGVLAPMAEGKTPPAQVATSDHHIVHNLPCTLTLCKWSTCAGW